MNTEWADRMLVQYTIATTIGTYEYLRMNSRVGLGPRVSMALLVLLKKQPVSGSTPARAWPRAHGHGEHGRVRTGAWLVSWSTCTNARPTPGRASILSCSRSPTSCARQSGVSAAMTMSSSTKQSCAGAIRWGLAARGSRWERLARALSGHAGRVGGRAGGQYVLGRSVGSASGSMYKWSAMESRGMTDVVRSHGVEFLYVVAERDGLVYN